MPLRILIAGCSKEEREGMDALVRGLLRHRLDDEDWNVSLVKLQHRWSVTLDGPDARLRAKNLMATDRELPQAIEAELQRAGFAGPAVAAPAPVASKPPARAAAQPVPTSAAARPTSVAPTARPTSVASAAPAARSRQAPPPPSPPRAEPAAGSIVGGERHDRHVCAGCGRPFLVVYPVAADDDLESVPVACPHCWQVGRFLVTAEAARDREYRAERLPS